jgi:hypothetical protein
MPVPTRPPRDACSLTGSGLPCYRVSVSDDPFDRPNYPGRARRSPKPAEPIWTLRLEHATWSAELRSHGESCGWETLILRDGELVNRRRFDLRRQAVQWAEEERKVIDSQSGKGSGRSR